MLPNICPLSTTRPTRSRSSNKSNPLRQHNIFVITVPPKIWCRKAPTKYIPISPRPDTGSENYMHTRFGYALKRCFHYSVPFVTTSLISTLQHIANNSKLTSKLIRIYLRVSRKRLFRWCRNIDTLSMREELTDHLSATSFVLILEYHHPSISVFHVAESTKLR